MTMKLLSTNTCRVPADLDAVTTYDPAAEADPIEAGMTAAQRDAIWGAARDLYKTGISPAITLCVRRHGKVVLNRAIGHASGNGPEDRKDTPKVLATPDTAVCLFSASKVVTAMLIHLLDERGDIDLLDPISHYIPEYGVRGKQNATIHHLLSHRGGIPSIGGDFDPELLYDVDGIVRELCAAKPVSPSGHRVAYHAITAGYIFGEIIQRVTGKNVREFLAETIQRPLGMRFFNYGVPEELRGDVALNYCTGFKPVGPVNTYIKHVLGGDLELAVNMTNDPRFMDTICPAGNIYATADEASRFFQLLLNGGELDGVRVFEPMTIKRAILESGRPEIDRTLLIPMRYSLGLMLGDNPVGLYGPMTRRAFGHLGFSNIFCWADPDRDTAVSILTTGKPLLGPHLAAMGKLLLKLSTQCPSAPRHRIMSEFHRPDGTPVL
jgi:CubicO group peptidase (beta-lactamase class C family)